MLVNCLKGVQEERDLRDLRGMLRMADEMFENLLVVVTHIDAQPRETTEKVIRKIQQLCEKTKFIPLEVKSEKDAIYFGKFFE